jgi:hypothetical protein
MSYAVDLVSTTITRGKENLQIRPVAFDLKTLAELCGRKGFVGDFCFTQAPG